MGGIEMSKLNIGVMFGGRSVEHEVSIITGIQVIENIDKSKYEVIPIYVSKEGDWYTGKELLELKNFNDMKELLSKVRKVFLPPIPGLARLFFYPFKSRLFNKEAESLKVDVIFPALHGMHGEDGTVQGLFKLANIPFVGCGVMASSVGMDKIIMKDIFKANGIPIVNYTWLLRKEYESKKENVISDIEQQLKYPMFVKPANLGSSIGISKARDRKQLMSAIEVAIRYDRKVIIEEGVEDLIEINCSVLGNDDEINASVCEQPVSWEDFLSFDDKYMRSEGSKGMKSATRKIPAPIPEKKSEEIKKLSLKVFKVLDCAGVSRIDFLMNKNTMEVYVNEINTIPGALAFYLWEPEGIKFKELIDRLIQIALKNHENENNNIYTFDTELLKKASLGGVKGSKVQ
jgi:D-alanine-D-alanine ligase